MILADVNIPPALPQWMKDHVDRYLRSDGRDGHMYTTNFPNQPQRTVPSLLLVTKGRKSGDKHLFPLFYGRAGKSYYVIASKGGAPDHPGWYKNLLADPEVEIQVGTERQKLWDDALKFWPDYTEYQKKAPHREIPVVVLDPI